MLEVGEESPPTVVIKQRGEETKAHLYFSSLFNYGKLGMKPGNLLLYIINWSLNQNLDTNIIGTFIF